MNLKQTGS